MFERDFCGVFALGLPASSLVIKWAMGVSPVERR